ncbi:class I SAM-dependent methyltransferase [Pelagibacterales bacterium]|nr:class I SAM-dependent methyltransferase [Pelagibacterales bacterium]
MSKERKGCKDFKDNIDGLTNRLNINNGYGNNDLQSWLIEQLRIKDTEEVLDLGCGDGRHLREISKLTNRDCQGIDYDEKMIDKSNSNSNLTENLQYHHLSMDDVNESSSPLGDVGYVGNQFNLIYSLYAFYYSKDSIALLGKLKKRLKENGRIAIIGPYGDNNKDWFKFLNQYVELEESIMKSSYSFMDDIKKYADDNFHMVTTNSFVNTITLPTYSDLKIYWKSNVYYDSKYDADFEKYATEHFDNNETFSYNKRAKLVMMEDMKS